MPALVQFFVNWAGLLIIGTLAIAAFAQISNMIAPKRNAPRR